MDAVNLLSLTDDYDTVLKIDLENGTIHLEHAKPELEDAFKKMTEGGFSLYRKLFAEKYVLDDDKDWFFSKTELSVIKEKLLKNHTYRLNYRIKKSDGQVVYYRSKFSRVYGNEKITEALVAGIRLDEQEWTDFEYYENKIHSTYNSIISGIAKDYDYIVYINPLANEEKCFYINPLFKKILDEVCDENGKIDSFQKVIKKLIYKDDLERFLNEVSEKKIAEELTVYDSFESVFRLKIKDELYNYKMQIQRDPGNLNGFIISLRNFDEQIKVQSLHKQQNMYHESLEAELEKELQKRTKEIERKNIELKKFSEDIVCLLGDITEARDFESGDHVKRVANYTRILAQQLLEDCPELGFTSETIELLSNASVLHDIGKITIPDAILLKPGKLTKEEFEIMKTHTLKGGELLKKAPKSWDKQYLECSMEICKFHHEKYDGKGYPYGLKGEEIPISAQIVSVIDCFDALSSKRVYKEAIAKENSIAMILNGECGAFSPRIINSLLKCKEKLFSV